MNTVLAFVIVFFFVALAVIAFVIYADAKTIVIGPRKFNYKEGAANTNSEQARASQDADQETGNMRASASLEGTGKADASARVGWEHQFTGTKGKECTVEMKFECRGNVSVERESASSKASVKAVAASDSKTFHEEVLTRVGETGFPASPSGKPSAHKFVFNLEPEDKFSVYLEIEAGVEGTDAAARAEVEARLIEISFRPKLFF